MPTIDFTGVFLSFNGKTYQNDSEIAIVDIRENDSSRSSSSSTKNYNGLQCITDKMPCCDEHKIGHWFFPNGTVVPEIMSNNSFYVTRGQNDGTVNLNRLNDSLIPTGRFCCEIPDALGNINHVCVRLTRNGGESVSYNCN